MTEYTIETTDKSGHWYILGSRRFSQDAQYDMRNHRKLFPDAPLRVIENPSRRIVTFDDPRPL